MQCTVVMKMMLIIVDVDEGFAWQTGGQISIPFHHNDRGVGGGTSSAVAERRRAILSIYQTDLRSQRRILEKSTSPHGREPPEVRQVNRLDVYSRPAWRLRLAVLAEQGELESRPGPDVC
jgi:hypothetical protein